MIERGLLWLAEWILLGIVCLSALVWLAGFACMSFCAWAIDKARSNRKRRIA